MNQNNAKEVITVTYICAIAAAISFAITYTTRSDPLVTFLTVFLGIGVLVAIGKGIVIKVAPSPDPVDRGRQRYGYFRGLILFGSIASVAVLFLKGMPLLPTTKQVLNYQRGLGIEGFALTFLGGVVGFYILLILLAVFVGLWRWAANTMEV